MVNIKIFIHLNGGCLGFQNRLGDEMMKVEKLTDVPMM